METVRDDDKVEVISVREVAFALGVAPAKVKSAIKNGTMPIGAVMHEDGKAKDRTVILKTRWDKWKAGEL